MEIYWSVKATKARIIIKFEMYTCAHKPFDRSLKQKKEKKKNNNNNDFQLGLARKQSTLGLFPIKLPNYGTKFPTP